MSSCIDTVNICFSGDSSCPKIKYKVWLYERYSELYEDLLKKICDEKSESSFMKDSKKNSNLNLLKNSGPTQTVLM